MIKQEEKVIIYDSPEAAQLIHLNYPDGTPYGKGWVSVNRRFYPIESQARTDSATHIKCETCNGIRKVGTYCRECANKKEKERYFKKPFKEYDGDAYLMIYGDDQFFRDEGEVREYCGENEILPENLMLVICEPNYLKELDGSEWSDIMPEDGDCELPKEVEEALKTFNEVIKKQGPISWGEGHYRTTISNVVQVQDLEFENGNG